MALRGYRILLLANCAILAVGAGRWETVPPFFLANHGQAPAPVRFLAKAPGLTAYFLPGEVLFGVAGNALRVRFEGAARTSLPEAGNRLPGVANFLTGPKARWLLAQPLYGGVAYRSLYPGIDMVYGGAGRNLKSEFVVAPGADPTAIHVRYLGGGKLRIGRDGSLAIPSGDEELREEAPIVYQERDGRRIAVDGRFVLAGQTVSFAIGEYDAALPLIIDPAISYSTLLGGSGANAANALAVDSTGAAYIAGFTESTNFPTANSEQNFNAGGNDVFIAKLNPAGAGLVYCTYLGGLGDDEANGIAVDAAGAAYVTGWTTSPDFPLSYPFQAQLAGSKNAFVVKLSAAGDALAYSTYLGGSSSDSGNGITVDGTGAAYVVGDTTSLNFPASGWGKANRGGQDAFVAKLSASGSQLAYSTYLGGSNTDHGAAIAVDTTGAAWVAGSTWSIDFPVANAFQNASGGGQDAFVARLSADGNTLLFGSYLGGSGGSPGYPEAAQAIALDWQGSAYLAGVTSSTNFPLLNPLQASLDGETDAFVTKVNASGSLAYSTYLGGSGVDVANAIAVDSSGAAYVAGYTYSTDLPVVDAIQAANAGDCDAFLARLSAGGTTLEYLTYLGGNASDTAAAVAVSAQNVYVAGWTLSTNFPLRNPYQSVVIDNYGAFLTEVDSGLPPVNQGVTPNSGGGASQTFGFQFSDASGTTDLTTVSVLFNSTPAVANACSVVYSRAANSLSLLTDAGGPPAASLTPGSGAQQNTQCVLNGAGSSVSSAGNVLTLNLAISFLPPMAGGPTNIYMQSANLSAATGWGLSGSWTVPAMIVSPSSMSWLPGASEVFQWTGIGSFVECTLSVSAIAAGDTDIFSGVLGSGTSQLVTNLPLNDRPLYVRLGSETSAGWLYVDYVYYAALLTAAGITSPANGSTLSGSTVTFQWSGGVGVSQYWLYASAVAPGGGDLDSINAGAQTSWILTNLPVNASTVYVRLSSLLNGSWRYSDYTYTAAGLSLAAMISPPAGSTLPASTVTFQWSAGVGVSQYWLYVSNAAPGGQEVYSGSQGTNTSKTFTSLPTGGGTIYVRLWSEIGATWRFLDYTYQSATALIQIAPPTTSAALASYLAATPFSSFDFSGFPNWDFVTPPTANTLSDGVLSLAFSATMLRLTADPNGWSWSVAPYSERPDASSALPILDAYNPLFNPSGVWSTANWFGLPNLTITLSRPVWTFGFEAAPDYLGTITATFYTTASGSLTISMAGMSYPNSRIFAATGAPITSVAIMLTNASTFPDFMVGAFRYALTGTTGPGLAQAATVSQAPTPSPAAMVSPANGASLPGSAVTFRWSAGVGVSEYWLYLSKLAPGGKEIYSNALGSNASMTFTTLPTDGSTLYVRLWSQIGAAWQFADYTYKTASAQ